MYDNNLFLISSKLEYELKYGLEFKVLLDLSICFSPSIAESNNFLRVNIVDSDNILVFLFLIKDEYSSLFGRTNSENSEKLYYIILIILP